ncbi:hypothetical protein [Aquicella lusitana]|uniref:Glycosyltransferase RgtA/B/C/D-like domain-containing protein n=1 Tax=Aquicella lusitana TaxID=254246 RepID=A0A370GT90_9COXI|nr:hypothetical protein [Aquicella lusitana]RDI46895.1 hypothetical protein C8D86_10417 [Aquicella lusitana]VVC73786.1 hypothetical protein AQULUS_15350 [Aquicella lusitana]
MAFPYKNFSLDTEKGYLLCTVGLVLLYIGFEFFYISHAGLLRDEFWFGHHVYQYVHHLPYRDFLPYKPVLGYYLLSIPLYFSTSAFAPLYYIKYEIALINVFFILITTRWLMRFFQPQAVFLTLIILCASQFFMIHSAQLRVDMLSSWLGLISLLLILSNRTIMAGVMMAIAFLVSQKALWFFAATNAAFILYWISASRYRETCWRMVKFNLAIILPVLAYVLGWAHYSSLSSVLQSVFYEGYTQSKITWYRQIYYECWQVILSSGSLFILLWPLTWLSLCVRTDDETIYKRRLFIAFYSTVMMILILSYQQAFPYNMVFCIPVFFVLYADFFSWLFMLFRHPSAFTSFLSKRQLFWFISVYCILTVSVMIAMGLPSAYFQTLLIPVSLGLLIYRRQHSTFYPSLILIPVLFAGIVYPLMATSISALTHSLYGGYQKRNIEVASDLLVDGGDYFAGSPLLYQKNQAIPGLMNLIGPAIDYLYHPSPDLLPILIPSLYLTPRTPEQILHDLKTKPVKFYINNNRIEALPAAIQRYLFSQYQHFWGSIFLYAPLVPASDNAFLLKFAGTYQLTGPRAAKVYIDNKRYQPGDKIALTAGQHSTRSDRAYRLKYLPEHKLQLDPKYQYYAREMLGST